MTDRCNKIKSTVACGLLTGHEGACVPTCERTYTESEMRLERAAWQREAAGRCRELATTENGDYQFRRGVLTCEKAILAIPADQSALDWHDAELRKDADIEIALLRGRLRTIGIAGEFGATNGKVMARLRELENLSDQARQYIQHAQEREHHFHEIEDRVAELKAQTAVMLEKAARLTYEAYSGGSGQVKFAATEASNNIRALIPANHAAALAERDKKIHYDGARWMLDVIRGSLRGYLHHGGDIEVMKDVDRIVADHVRQAVREFEGNVEAAIMKQAFSALDVQRKKML